MVSPAVKVRLFSPRVHEQKAREPKWYVINKRRPLLQDKLDLVKRNAPKVVNFNTQEPWDAIQAAVLLDSPLDNYINSRNLQDGIQIDYATQLPFQYVKENNSRYVKKSKSRDKKSNS